MDNSKTRRSAVVKIHRQLFANEDTCGMKETHFDRLRKDASGHDAINKRQAPPSGPQANRYQCWNSEGLSTELVGTK